MTYKPILVFYVIALLRLDVSPSEEILWMDWAFLMPVEAVRESAEISTEMCFFSGVMCRTEGLSGL